MAIRLQGADSQLWISEWAHAANRSRTWFVTFDNTVLAVCLGWMATVS